MESELFNDRVCRHTSRLLLLKVQLFVERNPSLWNVSDSLCSMTLTHSSCPTIICAEDVAFLHFLHSVPTLPSFNSVNHLAFHREGYALSFSREQDLVKTLAFLSYTKDDPDYVPALCVVEEHKLKSLNVFLAVNKSKREDGALILQKVKQYFEDIFTILSGVSQGS